MSKKAFNRTGSLETDTGEDIGVNKKYYADEDADVVYTVTETEGGSTAEDLSSASIEWVIYDTGNDSDIQSYTVSGGNVTVGGTDNNEVTVAVDGADTQGNTGEFECELTQTDDGSSNRVVLARGEFIITESYA
jgi:hypothetical protein